MSRIPLTPGVKERVSANVGRLYVMAMALPGHSEWRKELAASVDVALAIEEAVTEALCPTDIEGD